MLRVSSTVLAVCLGMTLQGHAERFGTSRGEISCDSCAGFMNMTVVFEDSNRRHVGTFVVAPNGSFEMYNMEEGTYFVSVKSGTGDILHTDVASLREITGAVNIRIPSIAWGKKRTAAETVSLAQLSHRVPKKARKLFVKAEEEFAQKDVENSIVLLKEALEIDPGYFEAINNLGSRYMLVNRPEEALAQFTLAAKLDPKSGVVQTNIAVALMTLRKYREAEEVARRAADMSGSPAKSRYLLGLSLFAQKNYSPEAMKSLESIGMDFPTARIPLAVMLIAKGQVSGARQQLNTYLASGNKERLGQAQAILASLP